MDADQFRKDFPEFADISVYPDSAVNLWLNLAIKNFPESRWCDYLDMGLCLFTAHNLVLDSGNITAASVGAVPGQVKGQITSKSVAGVTVSYAAGASTLMVEGGADFNLTTYGIRFLRIAQMIGAGGIQL